MAEERNVTETKISHDHGKMGGKWQASTLESKGQLSLLFKEFIKINFKT